MRLLEDSHVARVSDARKTNEINHGRKIVAHADDVWGWTGLAGRRRMERRVRLLTQGAAIGCGKRALELGCGTGVFTAKFSHRGLQLVATDISSDLLRVAQERVQTLEDVSLVLADVETLPFPDRTFDALIGSSILHHLPMPSSLHEMYRILRHGGTMAFAEPNMFNPQILVQKNIPWVKRWLGDTPDETAFVRWQFARMLHQVGFEQVQVAPHDFLHPRTPSAIVPVVQRLGHVLERLPLLREIAGSLLITARRPIR